ncbi:hypothetical protein Bca101_102014 [Brassica carinata]
MCKCRSHGTFPLFGLQSSHLNICYYHQDLHRRPLRPGSRPRFCSDRRALLLIEAWLLPRRPGIGRALQRHPFSGLVDSADERFARQYRCGPPPEFPLASPRSGIVHHLSGPDRHAHTRTLLRRSRSVGSAPVRILPISFLTPYGFTHPLTRTHVRLLGPCFKTGRMGSPQADALSTQMPRHAVRRVLQTTIKAATSPRAPFHLYLATAPRGATGSGHDGALTLSGAPFQGTWARSVAEDASPDYNSNAEDVRFSSWALPGLWVIESFWTGTTDDITRLEFTTACRDAPGALSSDFGQPRAADVPSARRLGAQLAFKDSMVHGFCNSHQVSHFATFFIDARAEISVAESRFRLYIAALLPNKHRLRVGESRLFSCMFLDTFRAGFGEIRKLCARSDRDLRYDNDPSAGSPTETLLRLLLPLNDKV